MNTKSVRAIVKVNERSKHSKHLDTCETRLLFMGVPLQEVRQRNGERIAAALQGAEDDLVGVLDGLPYADLDFWLDLVPGGNEKGVPNALGSVYEASLVFLRQKIAEFDLPYPAAVTEGIVPENTQNDDKLHDPDDSLVRIDQRFTQLSPEEVRSCEPVLRFVAFADMKARDRGTSMGKIATRAWVAGAFLRVTDVALACIATRIMLDLLVTDFYSPPYSTLDILLESSLMVPCGNGSTPQAARQNLTQFIESDELAAEVVSRCVDLPDAHRLERQTAGPDSAIHVAQARLATATEGPRTRAALVKLQIYSLCALFSLTSPADFDELMSKRAPSALTAIADLTRGPDSELFLPLKVAVADTLWFVLGNQDDDVWPEIYASRVGIKAQLATLKNIGPDKPYVVRLLSAVSYGITPVGSFFPGILSIATNSETPSDVKLIAGNVLNLAVRDESVTPSVLRAQNAYSLLVRELSNSAGAVASASTDAEAQIAAGLAEVYVHLFLYWISDARTAELEHALINGDFFEVCADLAAPTLRPFIRPRTAYVAINVAASMLDHTRIEPLTERGTASRFAASLFAMVDEDIAHLETVANMADKLWRLEVDTAYDVLVKRVYEQMIACPWHWTTPVRASFVQLVRHTETVHEDIVQLLNDALDWAVVPDERLPPNITGDSTKAQKFRDDAASLGFDLLQNTPLLEVDLVIKLFAAAKSVNKRPRLLQFYAAQNPEGCVSQFLISSAEALEKASFLLAIDKVALASTPFPPGKPKPDVIFTYEDLGQLILDGLVAGSLEAALSPKSSVYSSSVLFVLKETTFLHDVPRMNLLSRLFSTFEKMYSDSESGNIRQQLLFLRDITADWRAVGRDAADAYNETLVLACRILCRAFKLKDEPTCTLTFSVLGHIASTRHETLPLRDATNHEIRLVFDAALESETLRARFVIPAWFGESKDQEAFASRWKTLFPSVTRSDPAAVLKLADSISDRDFSRNLEGFVAAGNVALSEMREGHLGDNLKLVASIADRLQFPWISFENMNWPAVPEALGLLMDQFHSTKNVAELASFFGPLSALLEHTMCLAFLNSHEQGLSAEEQLSTVLRSPMMYVGSDSVNLVIEVMKSVLRYLQDSKVPVDTETDDLAPSVISGIAWLLVRLVDSSPDHAQRIIDSGLFNVLVECANSDFRQRDQTNDEAPASDTISESADPLRGLYRTADPYVVKVVEQSVRAVAHAISTSGVAGERKVIMLVDTPRIAGFDQLDHIKDVKSLILRRPELRHAVVKHVVRTSRGLAPVSDVPDSMMNLPALDSLTLSNISSMVSSLFPLFLGEDLRMAETAGDILVDLVCSVGATRDIVLKLFPDVMLRTIRTYGLRHVPEDPRLEGNLRDTHILETSIRFLSALTVQGLDDPFTLAVSDSLIRSSKCFFEGIVEIMKIDVMSDVSSGQNARASFLMYYIASLLHRASTMQNRLELPAWSRVNPKDNLPPFVRTTRASDVVAIYLTTYARLDPSALEVRMFRDEVLAMLEEYTILESYDWPQRKDTTVVLDDESDDNDAPPASHHQRHEPYEQHPVDRDVFRNSVLGDIDDENADEDEYMDIEDDEEMDSLEELDSGDELAGEASQDEMSYDESDGNDVSENDFGDRMSVSRLGRFEETESSSDEDVYLLGESSGENDSDSALTPEIVETVFTSEDDVPVADSAEDSSDSELADFDPESPDADTQMSSDVDIVLDDVQPLTGVELMNGILLRFNDEVELLGEPNFDVDETDTEDTEPYATSAMFTGGIAEGGSEPPVLPENDSLLVWWNESTMESSEMFAQVDSFIRENAPRVSSSVNDAVVAAVRYRQRNVEPSDRPFGAKRSLDLEKLVSSVVRMLFLTVFDQDRADISRVVYELLTFRDGRDAVVDIVVNTLFQASTGSIDESYARLCATLGASPTLPHDATPASVCANCVTLLCDVFESEIDASPEERDSHDRLVRRLSRSLLRHYGPKLVDLLTMPQICQNRKLLHNAAVFVLHALSIMGSRRFESSTETLAQLARVLGLRECTSESFSALTEIIQKHLRTDALLPNVIRETRRARSSLLVLLPAISKPDASSETVDAFAMEQVKLLRLMSLLNRVYEPQQVLAALKSVNLLPLWHSIGTRLNNGTLERPLNGRGFASGVSLLESLALALSAAVKWKAPVPDTHPGLTKYAQWVRSYLRTFMGHRKTLINELLRARPNLYMGPMGEMAKTLNLFDFQSKEKWFRAKVNDDAVRVRADSFSELRLSVRRQHVLEDSFATLYRLHGPILRSPMTVKFENEEAVDAGGVSREWLELIAREILNPEYGLFTHTQEGSSVYQVNRDSGVNPNHLDYFLVVGRVLGRTVYDGRMVGLYFSRIIYKYLLGRPKVTLADMEAVDEQYYKSLVWMLDMDVTDVIEETFSVTGEQFGRPFVVDLIENGRNIPVTEENKQEYVKRIVEYKLVESVKDQLDALRRGFNDVISPDLVEIFDEQELELLLCGLPTIHVDDWRANTIYFGYTTESPQIRWFWTAVLSFSTEERAKLLQFSTGTSRVHVHGFAHLHSNTEGIRFQIHKEHGSTSRWPSSHTCMNQINLPAYESYKKLRTMLLRAILEGSEGFGFV